MDSMRLIEEALAPLAGKTILDIGCGGGFLARSLSRRGAEVVGIDVSPGEIERARKQAPAARFEVAGAEALPFADASFDGAIFLNSLHHVAPAAMAAALAEAARITRPDGVVVVIEPLADGTFFAAFREIEDETAVRQEAEDAIRAALDGRGLDLVRRAVFVRRERFAGLDAFLDMASAADPGRTDAIAGRRRAIEAAFREHAAPDPEGGGFVLDQPMRAHVLRPRPA